VDPNTIGDFLNGKRVPSDVTLSKLAQALGLTLGMPEDTGEDAEFAIAPRDLADVSDEQLLSELGYRIFGLRREVGQLKRQPEAQKRPAPGNVRPLNPKQQRMLEDAQPVDDAAYRAETDMDPQYEVEPDPDS